MLVASAAALGVEDRVVVSVDNLIESLESFESFEGEEVFLR
jgi:hypothetical protein